MNITKIALGKREKLLIAFIFVFAIVSFVASYQNTIFTSIGDYLITEHPIEKADAIVVLSGSIPDRILEAVDFYKQGYAPLIILTKSEKPSGYDDLLKLGIKIPEGHDLNQMVAARLGVPSAAIVIIGKRINSTFSEMRVIYDYLKRRNLKSVILVTSKFHTTRATKLFNFVNDRNNIKLITRSSKYDHFDPKNWSRVRRDWKQVILEYQKLIHYHIFLHDKKVPLSKNRAAPKWVQSAPLAIAMCGRESTS